MSVRHEVLFVIATRIRFMCPMNYNKFPMDIQTCKFQVSNFIQIARPSYLLLLFLRRDKIGSFNYDNTKMRYHTYYLPKLPNSTESILDFQVTGSDTYGSVILSSWLR